MIMGTDDMSITSMLGRGTAARWLFSQEILKDKIEDTINTDHAARLGTVSTAAVDLAQWMLEERESAYQRKVGYLRCPAETHD
jgi:hypothetical protein